ncbi:DEAD/DEAH box helicase (plasmid) [Azospirillum sp. 412522]|nr:DEAD/DEAH box helicase [Azospirillum sp. 412522]MBY6266644.1 DEAD/DEAH box helicase [Azospirillum sp. 412522]
MNLSYNAGTGRWECQTEFSERDLPKNAGFRWAPAPLKHWWTTDPLIAVKLAAHADPMTALGLRAAAAAATALKQASAAASRATDANVEIPVPAGLSYLPYQKAGIAYAMARKDVLIADEMGLGKTIQAIGTINTELATRARVRALVVGPKIARINWRGELTKWLIKPLTIGIATTKVWPSTDVVIVNYDILSKLAERLRSVEWDIVVFDEAHALKDEKTARTKAALGGKGQSPIPAKRRLFLTGTPILNRPIELYPMLHAMGLPEASNYFRFASRYCEGRHTRFGFDASGASNLNELQDVLRQSVMVRRVKADVLTDLPEKRFSVVELPCDSPALGNVVAAEREALERAEQEEKRLRAAVASAKVGGNEAAYRAAVANLKAGRSAAFNEMSRLRHDTALAKVPQAVEHVADVLGSVPDAVLVFAHHTDVIEGIVAGLREAGYEPAVITGATSDAERQRAQDDIQGGRRRVFVGSMRACGVAITLTAASTVIFAEQDWTPGIMKQAEDRAHRIGQRNAVLVQHLVLDGSFDATMTKKVAMKGDVIDAALDEVTDAADNPSLAEGMDADPDRLCPSIAM